MEGKLKIIPAEINIVSEEIEFLQKQFTEAQTRLMATPSTDIYFKDFSPIVFQKTTTDADGKFLILYPLDKKLTIFAKTERLVGDKKETYFWLVNAPAGVEKAQLFLSNNNLVTVDPDGFFKIKPKSELQESVP